MTINSLTNFWYYNEFNGKSKSQITKHRTIKSQINSNDTNFINHVLKTLSIKLKTSDLLSNRCLCHCNKNWLEKNRNDLNIKKLYFGSEIYRNFLMFVPKGFLWGKLVFWIFSILLPLKCQ